MKVRDFIEGGTENSSALAFEVRGAGGAGEI